MAGARGIPDARKEVLQHRTLVEEILPGPVAYQHVHRSVAETAGVDYAAGRLADHPIQFVHYVEKLVEILPHGSGGARFRVGDAAL